MSIRQRLSNIVHGRRNIVRRLQSLSNQVEQCSTDREVQAIIYRRLLCDKAIHCTEIGVSDERYCDEEIVVSLTSHGERIHDVPIVIESIMQGSVKPNKIVLWLSQEEFGGRSLPHILQQQQKRGLRIAYCEDLKSYKKLIPSLYEYPEACIITLDDDVLYEYDIVERLIRAHINHPNAICACRMHRIALDTTNHPISYLDWEQCISDQTLSNLNFPTGGGGTLYPPHGLHEEVKNKTAFQSLCPTADDIWFYTMALLNNTPRIWVPTEKPDGYFHDLPSNVDGLYLVNTNPDNCLNDVQLKAVLDKYDLYGSLI